MKNVIRACAFMIIGAGLLTGCASSRTTEMGTINPGAIPALPAHVQTEQKQAETQQDTFKGIQMADIQPFAERVHWPNRPSDKPEFNITSGIADEVWIEGKGYFRGSLEDVYRDFTDVMVIGPTHLTQKIERDNFVEEELQTSYVMHVKMRYILSIEFDLSAILQPLFEGTEQTGWLYHSEKTSGTRFIQMIADTIVIKKLDNGWFSVEMLSVNKASQDKEEEARGHVEGLFAHWNEASANRIYAETPAHEATASDTPKQNPTEAVAETSTDVQDSSEKAMESQQTEDAPAVLGAAQ